MEANRGMARAIRTTYEGGLRVPAIAYWPGVIQPGVTNALAQNVDLFPTVRELAGLGGAQGSARVLDGVSMVPLLRGGASLREGVIYCRGRPGRLSAIGVFAV